MTKKVVVEKVSSVEDTDPTRINLRKLIWWNRQPTEKSGFKITKDLEVQS